MPGLIASIACEFVTRRLDPSVGTASGDQDHTTIFWYSVKHAETKKTH